MTPSESAVGLSFSYDFPFSTIKTLCLLILLGAKILRFAAGIGTISARQPSMSQQRSPTKDLRYTRVLLGAVVSLFICNVLYAQGAEDRINNIVLVHGAWADGSGWRSFYEILSEKGYTVSVVQEPETSFKDDVTAVKRILALQNGRCVLVAHSYGGSVITEAGTDPVVAGLVYMAAHMPDNGESEAGNGKRFPSDLSKAGAIKARPDGFTYLNPDDFASYFAADVPLKEAQFIVGRRYSIRLQASRLR